MKDFKNKVQDSANFYNASFLNFNFKLTKFNYLSLKPFFKRDLALELGPAIGQMSKFLVLDLKTLRTAEESKELLDQLPNYDNLTKHFSNFEEFETDLKFSDRKQLARKND